MTRVALIKQIARLIINHLPTGSILLCVRTVFSPATEPNLVIGKSKSVFL